MKHKGLFFLLFFIFFHTLVFSQEIPTITVEPTSFTKIVIRVPDFEGPKEISFQLSSLLRKLLNYHLFILALKEPPLTGYASKEYYFKAHLEKKNDQIFIKAELWDNLENKILKIYKVEGNSNYPQSLIYALCDKLVETISSYKGISFSKIAFVKRTSQGDKLYITDFSKENPKLINSAPLILFPKFSKSGDKIAYIVYQKNKYILEIYNIKKDEKREFFIDGLASAPVWLPNERELILTIEEKGNISLYKLNLETGTFNLLLKQEGILQAGSVSPDENLLAYVNTDRTGKPQIYFLDLKTLKTYKIPQKFCYNTSPRFSSDGKKLLFLSKSGNISSIILYNINTKEQREIKFMGKLKDPAFSPTGDYILIYGETREGKGLHLIHLDSQLSFLYLAGDNFIFPDWAPL